MTLVGTLRRLLLAGYVGAVFGGALAVVGLVGTSSTVLRLGWPFAAAALALVGLGPARAGVDRLVRALAPRQPVSAYDALASASGRLRAGPLERVLPGLAQVLAEGTRAEGASVWLALNGQLVRSAVWPDSGVDGRRTVADLAVLLSDPDVDYAVPVLDGAVLRAVLSIGKPGAPVTPADQQLLQDVANGTGLLLRGIALNADLHQRVRRADELARELTASRQRLTQARDVERRRLVAEIATVATPRLAAIRESLDEVTETLRPDPDGDPDQYDGAGEALRGARAGLDELIDRFRLIVRGVYPAVLRDQGPAGALEELASDLPRRVRLSGQFDRRSAWEVESGIYYVAASALQLLAGQRGTRPLRVQLEQRGGRLAIGVTDPDRDAEPDQIREIRAGLAEDAHRLSALGGRVEVAAGDRGGLTVLASLPEQLEPVVESAGGQGGRG